ncbi:addiction module toxin, HicA family [Patescibacteria group bacterium]|jgi:predicted RNA binding protein YcfA (HicA-like mRNA interferase family)|nr:addiction module toxin, HicA family [Patescibacteria group bacterium]
MPKLKTLSGDEVRDILTRFGFSVVSQRGSHLKLARESQVGRQVLTIPRHKELARGTLKAIYTQASRFVSPDDLWECFYTE